MEVKCTTQQTVRLEATMSGEEAFAFKRFLLHSAEKYSPMWHEPDVREMGKMLAAAIPD